MADEFEEQAWVKFGVAATLTKQYSADQRVFLELLAQMLERALPEETEIRKQGGIFSKKTVRTVQVTLNENRYLLEDPGRGPLQASRVHVVRGIALKTEPLAVPDWLAELGAGLEERARTSAAAREALQRMIG